MGMSSVWDINTDLLIVGSGNGALTSAVCSYDMGISKVLVIEKCAQFGGTSAMSGGGVWIPCSRYAKECGAEDSFDDAKQYLMSTIPEDIAEESMIDTYLINGPKMLDFLHQRTPVRYESLSKYPDYYTDRPGAREGHRSLEPAPINIDAIGPLHRHAVQSSVYMFERIGLTQVEAQQLLIGDVKDWALLGGKRILAHYLNIPWMWTHKQSRRATLGMAGIIRLMLALQARHIPLRLNTSLKELVIENNTIVGAVIESAGKTTRVRANKGVMLAAGGFEQNQTMREQYLPKPTNTAWSAGIKTNTGDAIQAGMRIGAKTRLMDNAWWCPTLCIPGMEYPFLGVTGQALPGTITVNRRGQRFSNESQNYMNFLKETFAAHTEDNPCVPAYRIFDVDFKKRYAIYPLMMPTWMIPKSFLSSGFAGYADTLPALANQMGIDAEGLQSTVEQFNRYARDGKDPQFHRGDVAYDRYYGDPQFQPNPCLGPIVKPPFFAMKMQPGDIGTQGGLAINENAQVLNHDEEPITGLYACGNNSAAVLPTYPGPGSTLGPAMTFAYQAAKHLSGWQEQ